MMICNAEAKDDTTSVTVTNKESASIYPSLSPEKLNTFRKLIEDGNLEEFRQCIWNNPRYLVSGGDAPVSLKPPTRYNALHVATRCNRVEFCKEILTIIESMEFWTKLYPDDTQEARIKRRRHVVDLYLNMPDKTVCTHVWVHVCMPVCVRMCGRTCVCVRICVCVCTPLCVYVTH